VAGLVFGSLARTRAHAIGAQRSEPALLLGAQRAAQLRALTRLGHHLVALGLADRVLERARGADREPDSLEISVGQPKEQVGVDHLRIAELLERLGGELRGEKKKELS
jgi:hypothetical protein